MSNFTRPDIKKNVLPYLLLIFVCLSLNATVSPCLEFHFHKKLNSESQMEKIKTSLINSPIPFSFCFNPLCKIADEREDWTILSNGQKISKGSESEINNVIYNEQLNNIKSNFGFSFAGKEIAGCDPIIYDDLIAFDLRKINFEEECLGEIERSNIKANGLICNLLIEKFFIEKSKEDLLQHLTNLFYDGSWKRFPAIPSILMEKKEALEGFQSNIKFIEFYNKIHGVVLQNPSREDFWNYYLFFAKLFKNEKPYLILNDFENQRYTIGTVPPRVKISMFKIAFLNRDYEFAKVLLHDDIQSIFMSIRRKFTNEDHPPSLEQKAEFKKLWLELVRPYMNSLSGNADKNEMIQLLEIIKSLHLNSGIDEDFSALITRNKLDLPLDSISDKSGVLPSDLSCPIIIFQKQKPYDFGGINSQFQIEEIDLSHYKNKHFVWNGDKMIDGTSEQIKHWRTYLNWDEIHSKWALIDLDGLTLQQGDSLPEKDELMQIINENNIKTYIGTISKRIGQNESDFEYRYDTISMIVGYLIQNSNGILEAQRKDFEVASDLLCSQLSIFYSNPDWIDSVYHHTKNLVPLHALTFWKADERAIPLISNFTTKISNALICRPNDQVLWNLLIFMEKAMGGLNLEEAINPTFSGNCPGGIKQIPSNCIDYIYSELSKKYKWKELREIFDCIASSQKNPNIELNGLILFRIEIYLNMGDETEAGNLISLIDINDKNVKVMATRLGLTKLLEKILAGRP